MTLLEQLQALDPAVLTGVVRQDQRDPDLTLLDWTVASLTHEKIIITTGGLFRFSGQAQGRQGVRPWAVALKCLKNPTTWGQQPCEWNYWQREILIYQSGLLRQLPPGIRAPHCYGVIENEQGAWIWIEHIQETTGKRWSLDNFQRAAWQLGHFQSAYLDGMPLPSQPWLCRPFFRSIWADQGNWSRRMHPASVNTVWDVPTVQAGFDARQKAGVVGLLAEKEHFFEVNDRLPQVFCHNDAHRRNLMWSQSSQTGAEELVGIDWAFTGVGAVGNDLGQLVGGSLKFFEYDPYAAETLAAAVLDGYQAGIAASGARIDPRLVRLGYLIGLCFWQGAMLPGWAALLLPPDSGIDVQAMYGRPAAEVLAGWGRLEDFFLDRADEARRLMGELGM